MSAEPPRHKAFRSSPLVCLLAVGCVLVGFAGCARQQDSTPRAPLVLIIVDTLRADRLGLYGYERSTSPNLDRWATSARVYESALATASYTLPSVASMFTGLLPREHGAGARAESTADQPASSETSLTGLPAPIRTVAQVLAEAGYRTHAIINNPMLSPAFGIGRGFETYDYVGRAKYRRANRVVDLALEAFDQENDRNLFLVVHLFDPHLRYHAPAPFRGRWTGGSPSSLKLPVNNVDALRTAIPLSTAADRTFISDAYDEEVAFVDAEIDRLLQGLKQRGAFEEGLVLFTSDHGEELFEHGGFEHGHALWEEVVRVPLLAWGQGIEAGRERTGVTVADIGPTLLDAAGLSFPEPTPGRSLWPSMRGAEPLSSRPRLVEGTLYGPAASAVYADQHTLIVDPAGKRLYDLGSDPAQHSPLDDASKAESMHRLLEAFQQAQGGVAPDAAELDPETRAQLKALGYVD